MSVAPNSRVEFNSFSCFGPIDARGFIEAALLAALCSLAFFYPASPGFMNFDTLFAIAESQTGVVSNVPPPVHVYLFSLANALGVDLATLFFVQIYVLLLSLNLLLASLIGRPLVSLVASLLLVGLIAGCPSLITSLCGEWKDMTMAVVALAGLALLVGAHLYRSYLSFILALLLFVAGVGLRYNALPIFLIFFAQAVAYPIKPRAQRTHALATSAFILVLLVATVASTVWRLPDFRRIESGAPFQSTQVWDLAGITACSGKMYMPLVDGVALETKDIRNHYDPRSVELIFGPENAFAKGFGKEMVLSAQLSEAWKKAVVAEFPCYLAHRWSIFVQSVGLVHTPTFFPGFGGIDVIEGLPHVPLDHPAAAGFAYQAEIKISHYAILRPFFMYIVGAAVLSILFILKIESRYFFLQAVFGCLLYVGALFFVSPGADARYIFLPNLIVCLIIVAGAAQVALRWRDFSACPPSGERRFKTIAALVAASITVGLSGRFAGSIAGFFHQTAYFRELAENTSLLARQDAQFRDGGAIAFDGAVLAPGAVYQGGVDEVALYNGYLRASGWLVDGAEPARPLKIAIATSDRILGVYPVDNRRPDVASALNLAKETTGFMVVTALDPSIRKVRFLVINDRGQFGSVKCNNQKCLQN